jgi:hypothetical protein
MQFENAADGRIFHNVNLAQNYRISATVTPVDCTAQVLRQATGMLVSGPRDSRHESRSAAPGWPGAKSELIGHN